jgi:hypothetical protein
VKPFFQFRLWLQRGPTTERALVIVSTAVVLALLVWVSIPTGQSPESSLAVGGPAGSTTGQQAGPGAVQGPGASAAPGQTGGATAGSGAVGGTGGPGGGGTGPRTTGGAAPGTTSGGTSTNGNTAKSPTSTGCSDAASNEVGVTSKQILLGVILLDLGQLNSFVGIPSQDDQKKAYNAIFASYNSKGGVRCRALVPKYYADNPLDASGEQATCLQIVQDKVFAVLNNLGGSQSLTCLPQRKVPGIWYTPPTTVVMKQFSPYIISHMPDYDRLIKDYVVGAKRYKFFDAMNKLGIIEMSCVDDQNKAIAKELAAIGIHKDQIDIYDYGCPTAVSSPDQDQAAALQFQRNGVTHVMNTAYTYITNFASAAEKQNYKPHYAIAEDGAMAAIAYTRPPPVNSFDQTLAVTSDQVGAENTKGVTVSPATLECSKLMKSIGLATPTTPGAEAGALYGNGCAVTKLFAAAVTNAPTLNRTSLTVGVSRAGELDLSYPPGPMHVTSPSVPTGGQWYRGARWYTSCQCWRVIDKVFHPGA